MTNLRANSAGPLLPTIAYRAISSAHYRDREQSPLWKRILGLRAPDNLAAVPNKPPGTQGEKGELKVGDVMSADVISVTPDTTVREIAALLGRHHISSVPVIDRAECLVGIVSEGDLIKRVEIGTEPRRSWWRALFSDGTASAHGYVRSHGRRARDVMSANPITANPDEPLHRLATDMAHKRLRRVPVVRDGRLVGVIARSDLIRQLARHVMPQADSTDEAARTEIMARIRTLPWSLQVHIINVDVRGGIATLYGWAASPRESRAVEVLAENTPGVVQVRNCTHRTLPYI